MKALLGTVVVENMGGGGGSLGAAAAAHAPPDGYTLLLGGTLPHVNEALVKGKPLYDPAKDLDPIAGASSGPGSDPKGTHSLRSSQSWQPMLRSGRRSSKLSG